MKTFKLNSILYKNIMSVGDTPVFVQLDKCHKTLITGTNGTGKSTMIEAITFALFGKPFRDIKKNQLINSVTNKNMLVELVMEYNGHKYEIKRGQKPTVFSVIRDGVPIDESASVRDFQAEFEEMIGMNYNSYKQVVVLGTAGYTPFMGLTAPNRRKLVEDLLEVNILADMDKLNKVDIKGTLADIQTVDMEISHIQTQIKTHEEYAERQKKLSGDNVNRLQKMYDECVDEVQAIKEKNIALNEELLAKVLPEDPSYDIQDIKKKYTLIESQVNSKNKVLGLYERGGNCPTCLQVLQNKDLINEINENLVEFKSECDKLIELEKSLSDKKLVYSNTKAEIDEIERTISNNRNVAMTAVGKAKRIKEALTEAKKDFVDNSETIDGLKDDLNIKISYKSDLLIKRHRLGLIADMLKDSGIKSSIIKKYIPLFNKQINHYLHIMEADYSFNINEEFSETIKSRGRENFSYSSFSQGEKARIDLALLFTWRDIAEVVSGIKINCLFLDEVADGSTDLQGVKTIQQILNQLNDTNVFIISHRDHNPQDYGQHLQMRKVGRFTIME